MEFVVIRVAQTFQTSEYGGAGNPRDAASRTRNTTQQASLAMLKHQTRKMTRIAFRSIQALRTGI